MTEFIKKINSYKKTDEIGSTFFLSGMTSETIDKYDRYPKNLQNLMISEYKIYLNNASLDISQFDVQKIYEFLEGKISCEEATKIYNKYQTKLISSEKPC